MSYMQLLREARSKGLVISKEYLKEVKERYKNLDRRAPNLWKAAMSRRYLLPSYLAGEYINQEVCDYLFVDFLTSFTSGYVNDKDDVVDTCYLTTVRALEYNRPTYYLERKLGERLMETEVPSDLAADDIHWIYPQFRIYLPIKLLAFIRNGQINSAMFVDVCKIDQGDAYHLAPEIKRELTDLANCWKFPPFAMSQSGFAITANLHFDCPESNISYAITAPWEGKLLHEIITATAHDLHAGMINDETDKVFLDRTLRFTLNIMLFLSNIPKFLEGHFLQVDGAKPVRRPKQEGKHAIAGLYQPKIIGFSDAYKPSAPSLGLHTPTGRHLPAHWKKGHWKRQPHGPKFGLRRMIWIQPYHTYDRSKGDD